MRNRLKSYLRWNSDAMSHEMGSSEDITTVDMIVLTIDNDILTNIEVPHIQMSCYPNQI